MLGVDPRAPRRVEERVWVGIVGRLREVGPRQEIEGIDFHGWAAVYTQRTRREARCERSASTWAAPSPTSRSGTTRAARWPSSNCPRSRRIPPSALFELQAATRRRSWDQSSTDWVIDSELLLVGQRTHWLSSEVVQLGARDGVGEHFRRAARVPEGQRR